MLMDEKDFEQKLKVDFLAESAELLQEIESAFLRLEKNPDDRVIIDEVFRVVHTIKGSAGAVGFGDFSNFAHVLETLLGTIRDGKIFSSQYIVDTLLHGVDTLKLFVSTLRRNYDEKVDTLDVVQKINSILEEKKQTYPNNNPKQPKILIVDDFANVVEIFAAALKPLSTNILTARDGEQAIAIWQDNPDIKLIITDNKMPRMDGCELVARVRQSDPDLPIIVASGATSQEDAIKYIQLRVFDFLPKPVNDAILLNAARSALRLSYYRNAIAQLSQLTIRAFITHRKMLEKLEQSFGPDDPSVLKLSNFFQEMGLIIAEVMNDEKSETSEVANDNDALDVFAERPSTELSISLENLAKRVQI